MYVVFFFLVKSTKTARGSLNLLCQPKNKRPSLLPRALILLTKLMIGVDAGDYRTEIESLHCTFSNSLYVGSKFIAWMKDRKGGLVNVPYSYQLWNFKGSPSLNCQAHQIATHSLPFHVTGAWRWNISFYNKIIPCSIIQGIILSETEILFNVRRRRHVCHIYYIVLFAFLVPSVIFLRSMHTLCNSQCKILEARISQYRFVLVVFPLRLPLYPTHRYTDNSALFSRRAFTCTCICIYPCDTVLL